MNSVSAIESMTWSSTPPDMCPPPRMPAPARLGAAATTPQLRLRLLPALTSFWRPRWRAWG